MKLLKYYLSILGMKISGLIDKELAPLQKTIKDNNKKISSLEVQQHDNRVSSESNLNDLARTLALLADNCDQILQWQQMNQASISDLSK